LSDSKERESMSLYMDISMWETKKLDKIDAIIEKLNWVYSNETYCINDNGYLVFKNKNEEDHQYIANFFVVPTHWLYCYYGDTLEHSDGLAVTVYHKWDDKKYVKVHINVKNDAIVKGDWVNPKYLDYCFNLPIQSNYQFLRSALRLATKRIKSKNKKLFDGEKWLDGWEAKQRINQYYEDYAVNQIYVRDATQRDSLEKDALEYLKDVDEYIKINSLTDYNIEPENDENHIGWIGDANNEIIYLLPKKLDAWIAEIKPNFSKSKNMIHSHLVKEGILSTETESKGRIRTDVNRTVYPKNKQRVYEFFREKFDRFLSTKT